jgi:hypothetical protein
MASRKDMRRAKKLASSDKKPAAVNNQTEVQFSIHEQVEFRPWLASPAKGSISIWASANSLV